MGLPAEVLSAGRHNARRTGIDEADGISYTAQAWAEHPEMWRTVAHRRCVEERRRVSGRTGADRRALAILDEPTRTHDDIGANTLGDIILAVDVDPGIAAVEGRIALGDLVGGMSDADLAALARGYWLGIPAPRNSAEERARMQALRHARGVKDRTQKPPKPAPPVALSVVPPAPEPEGHGGPCPLTAKELAVVVLVADGLTQTEIGKRLSVSANTVKTHLRRITARLHAGNSAHVVGIAFRAGWIT